MYYWQNNQWELNSKVEYAYNGDKQTEQISYAWQDNQWIPSYKQEYNYSGDKQTKIISYMWRDNQWNPNSKQEYTYNLHGNIESYVGYMWRNEEWTVSSISSYDNYEYIPNTDFVKWYSYHITSNQYNYSTGELERITYYDYKLENYWTISTSTNEKNIKRAKEFSVYSNNFQPFLEMHIDEISSKKFD